MLLGSRRDTIAVYCIDIFIFCRLVVGFVLSVGGFVVHISSLVLERELEDSLREKRYFLLRSRSFFEGVISYLCKYIYSFGAHKEFSKYFGTIERKYEKKSERRQRRVESRGYASSSLDS